MNKKIALVLIALLWVAVAAGFIYSKQLIFRTGKAVLLETMPVDPRDLLRGDYVVLSYKIGQLELDKIRKEKGYFGFGEVVYVTLEKKETYWEASAVSSKKPGPGDGIFIKGRVASPGGNRLMVNYGIESYFVPEGEGRQIERAMGRSGKQRPSVEAVIDRDGNAIIKKVLIGERK